MDREVLVADVDDALPRLVVHGLLPDEPHVVRPVRVDRHEVGGLVLFGDEAAPDLPKVARQLGDELLRGGGVAEVDGEDVDEGEDDLVAVRGAQRALR